MIRISDLNAQHSRGTWTHSKLAMFLVVAMADSLPRLPLTHFHAHEVQTRRKRPGRASLVEAANRLPVITQTLRAMCDNQ